MLQLGRDAARAAPNRQRLSGAPSSGLPATPAFARPLASDAHAGRSARVSHSDQWSKCSCYYVSEHEGEEAKAYVAEHLEKVRVDSERWTVEYRCPLYGKQWLSDQPWGEMHGGGPLRLRTFERVRRGVKMSLYAVSSLLPARPEADEHVQALLDSLGSCQEM